MPCAGGSRRPWRDANASREAALSEPVKKGGFAAKPWYFVREPVARKLLDGTMVCTHYSGGPSEPHPDNLTLITKSHDDGATWPQRIPVARAAEGGIVCYPTT